MKTPHRLHHAYGILREDVTVSRLMSFFADDLGVATVGNPDFFHEQFEALTIDDSRRIKEFALSRRFSADRPRVFLLEIYGATREAQNALLKLFEEPEEGNHFFLVLPSFDIFLPTLRSRLSFSNPLAGSDAPTADIASADAVSFLKSSIKSKIALVDELAGDISDEKKAKHEAIAFLNDLERTLHAGVKDADGIKRNKKAFEAIARVRSYMNDRAPSLKMLLEYVALSL